MTQNRTNARNPVFRIIGGRALGRRLGLLRLAKSEEGANMVEFALSALIFLSLLFGVIEFAYAYYTYQDISDAARKAARWASVRGSVSCTNVPNLPDCGATNAEVQTYVQNLGYPGLNSSKINVTTKWCPASSTTSGTWTTCSTSGSNAPGNQVQVMVSYTFPIGLPYLAAKTIGLQSTASMVIAQ
jgi:Flp pilus assembly protein TadG